MCKPNKNNECIACDDSVEVNEEGLCDQCAKDLDSSQEVGFELIIIIIVLLAVLLAVI